LKHKSLTDAYPPDQDAQDYRIIILSYVQPMPQDDMGLITAIHIKECLRIPVAEITTTEHEDHVHLTLPAHEALQFKQRTHALVTDGLNEHGQHIPARRADYYRTTSDGITTHYATEIIHMQNGKKQSVLADRGKRIFAVTQHYYNDQHTMVVFNADQDLYQDFEDIDGNPLPAQIVYTQSGDPAWGVYYKDHKMTGKIMGADLPESAQDVVHISIDLDHPAA
jgi:hypothetical protein